MLAISIENLVKTFPGHRRQPVRALLGLSLSVDAGEVFGFLGPNGAGKSTTIKTLLGQVKPTSGSARIFGQPASSALSRARVGYLPENPSFYDYLTAGEYLELVGRCFRLSHPALKGEITRVLGLLDLEAAAQRPIRGYSKGMVQRLGLAQAMLHDPDLYILDEPMSGLDPVGRVLVKEIMLDLKRKGKTVFFSTHVIADVEAVCDRVGIVAQGELRAENSVNAILAAGIDGYLVRLDRLPPTGFSPHLAEPVAVTTAEFFVPRQQFNLFMREVDQAGCAVQFVEPRRKSLEEFFLSIIHREKP